MARVQVPPSLAEVLDVQDGVVSRAQAMTHGLSPGQVQRLVGRGWVRLLHGVYSARGDGWRQRAWAGVLAGGEGACLGGSIAARLHGLAQDEVTGIDVWTPAHRTHQHAAPQWRFHRGRRAASGSPPRVSLEQAVLDLCARASDDDRAGWVTRAITERRTTPERMRAALEAAPRLRGRAGVLDLVNWLDAGVESPLELRFVRDVQRRNGLPDGARQVSLVVGARVDVRFEEFRLIAELDGLLGHRGVGEAHDAWRDARHLALGEATVRFGWGDVVRRPCATAALLADVLRSRGWAGTMRRCPACPDAPSASSWRRQ